MQYKITFLDYWHLSSGLSGGAKYDNSVIKDDDGFPFVPGKTIKGLLREYAQGDFLQVCFGNEGDKIAQCYFNNATLSNATKENSKNFLPHFFDFISSTKINQNGVAEDGSLREIEVVIPLSLYGSIDNLPKEFELQMIETLKKIKRIGLNRSRGLGRCKIEIIGQYNG